jgi:WD40 repeat protein
VRCLTFSPDGSTLAAAYDGEYVVLWNAATGEKRTTFHGYPGEFQCLAFSPDGKTLASGGAKSDIKFWDVETAQTKTSLLDSHGLVTALRFAPDGQTLASGYWSGMVKLWGVIGGRGRELLGSNLRGRMIVALAFSSDGSKLAAGSLSNGTGVWDLATGGESASFQNGGETIREFGFSRSGQMLIEITQGQLVRIRELAVDRNRILLRFRGLYSTALTPDGRFLAAADDDAVVRVWDLARVH